MRKSVVGPKMADNRKETKENQTRWIFRDSTVEDLIEALEASKTEYEGRGLDFEGDLVKLYSELRKTMSEKYEETDFGPTAVSEPTKLIEEMSKEEFKEHKKNADAQQKAIKLGYDRIKAKVKKLRSNFQKAVAEGTRSGSGRIIKDNWDALVRIWSGAPGAQPLEFGKSSIEDTDESHSEASHSINEEVIRGGSNATEDSEAMNEDEGTLPDSKKRKSAIARFVDDKRKKLEKQLSGKQKDGLMLQVMREDVELKKKLLVQSEQPSKADDALMKIADSMHTLSQAILTGFQHLQAQSLQHQPVARGTQEQTVVQDQFLAGRYGYQTNQVPGTIGSRPFTPPPISGRASPYSVSMSSNSSVIDSSDDPDHTYFSL